MKLRDIKKIIRLYYLTKLSFRAIGKSLNTPKSTIADYINRFNKSGLSLLDLDSRTEDDIYQALFPDESKRPAQRLHKMLPDWVQMHLELKKKFVTKELLWNEYKDMYPDNHYGYTHFCNLFKAWQKRIHVSMRINHKAGEKMFLDFSGLKWEIIDKNTGEATEVDILVATLAASGYTYAKATRDQTTRSLIAGTINALEYFDGVTELFVPDNMKAAVKKADKYDPVINEAFASMADHYDAVVFPTRTYKAKDKAKVELSVKLVQRWILAKLRHQHFFSLAELNQAIFDLLSYFNNRMIRRYGKSRFVLYQELDKPALKPLPARRYEYREFKYCRVNIDYHIELDGSFYSVPYQLAGQMTSVFYTADSVDIYNNNKRVAIHVRSYIRGSYSTKEEHMASAHRVYGNWNPSRLINWGGSIGEFTKQLISEILASKPHPEMGFRSCMAILNEAKHYHNRQIIEMTSKKMLELKYYRVANFKEILKNKTYLESQDPSSVLVPKTQVNLRGRAYYQ
jgi:transposase